MTERLSTATTVSPEATPRALAEALEALSERLQEMFAAPRTVAVQETFEECMDELRWVCSALSSMTLLFDPDRIGALSRREEEISSLARILTDSIRVLGRTNRAAATRLSSEMQELDTIVGIPDDREALERLRGVAVGLREASGQLARKLDDVGAEVEGAGDRIAALERELEETRRKAFYDALTKVRSRAALDERLRAEVESGRDPWCFLMADIDHFKAVNDQNGHLVGDALLVKVAAAIEHALHDGRAADAFVGRYGGEEFAIILPDSALEDALPVAEAVRSNVASSRWQIRGGTSALLRATISLGVTQRREGDTVADVVRRADEALYRAKQAGRNTVMSEDR